MSLSHWSLLFFLYLFSLSCICVIHFSYLIVFVSSVWQDTFLFFSSRLVLLFLQRLSFLLLSLLFCWVISSSLFSSHSFVLLIGTIVTCVCHISSCSSLFSCLSSSVTCVCVTHHLSSSSCIWAFIFSRDLCVSHLLLSSLLWAFPLIFSCS